MYFREKPSLNLTFAAASYPLAVDGCANVGLHNHLQGTQEEVDLQLLGITPSRGEYSGLRPFADNGRNY